MSFSQVMIQKRSGNGNLRSRAPKICRHLSCAIFLHVYRTEYSTSHHEGLLSTLQTLPPPSHIPNSPISPPLPIPPPAVFCIRPIYCLLTVFHAAMYFSMHVVKHFSSLDDSEEPGMGMHFSKQWLFIFWEREVIRTVVWVAKEKEVTRGRRSITDMSWRALLMAASC